MGFAEEAANILTMSSPAWLVSPTVKGSQAPSPPTTRAPVSREEAVYAKPQVIVGVNNDLETISTLRLRLPVDDNPDTRKTS